jgi:Ca2+-binding EF-hand superfamily protein
MRTILGLLATGLLASGAVAADDGPASKAQTNPSPPGAAAGPDAVQDVIFLGDRRPIFVRLRMTLGGRPFRAAWSDSVRAMHDFLDRDGDGSVSEQEAARGSLATLVRIANGGATAMPRGDLDVRPRDGVVSIDELADALRTALGPFRVQAGKLSAGTVDAVFERLDRDGDGKLDRAELDAADASIRRLDLDEDELIDEVEVEPFADPTAMAQENMPGRRGRLADGPPVLDLAPEEGTLRPVRLLLKKYDKGAGAGPMAGDNKLSAREFAIDPAAFARADADADGALDTEEIRRYLAGVAPDITLDVAMSEGPATVAVAGPLPPWAKAKAIGEGDVEIAADEVRLDIHADGGSSAAESVRRSYLAQFQAADADKNGYLEKEELTRDKDHPSPLAALFDLLDRDGDEKLYPKEVEAFVDAQARAARERMVLTASDQGRAIFSILDLNRDRRLGLREVRDTPARVAAWDRDGDGRIADDEIPHHYQLAIGRGSFGGIGPNPGLAVPGPMNPQAPGSAAAPGPNWFRRMDRNRDGDVSPREFRGPVAQFERIDRDKDGLIDAPEAAAARPVAPGPGGK